MGDALINGLLVFLVGMLVIFTGMTIIILAINLVGKVITSLKIGEETTTATTTATVTEEVVEEVEVTDGIPAEIRVAIIAAVTSYYFSEEKSKCDFIVKKIKRL